MKIKILFRIALLSLGVPLSLLIMDDIGSDSILANEVNKLSEPAIDELCVFLDLSVYFLVTIAVIFLVAWIGLFFFWKWARQLYLFTMLLVSFVILPTLFNESSGSVTGLLSFFPLYFVLILVYIKPIKKFFNNKKDANKENVADQAPPEQQI